MYELRPLKNVVSQYKTMVAQSQMQVNTVHGSHTMIMHV